MSDGLRAIAKDLPVGRLATTARLLAERLEEGQSLDAALVSLGPSFPEHIRGMVAAGGRSGRLGRSLGAVLAHERAMDDLSRQLWQAVAYPMLLFVFLTGWLVFMGAWLIPSLAVEELVHEFGTSDDSGFSQAGQRLDEFARIVPPLVLTTLGIALATLAACARWAARPP